MKSIEATRTYLQMLSPDEHKPVVNLVGDRLQDSPKFLIVLHRSTATLILSKTGLPWL